MEQREKLRMPDRAQRLYTDMDYQKALYVTDGDSELALMMEEKRGCGFGFMYMNVVHQALDTKNNTQLRRWQREVDNLDQEAEVDVVCDLLNSQFENVRHYACRTLNLYAREKGFIDAWPQPNTSAGVIKYGKNKNGRTDGVKVSFDFFAPDFTYKRKGDTNIISRGNELKLHRYYSSIERPTELVWAEDRVKELRKVKTPTANQRRISILKWIVARIPMYLMLLMAVLFLIGAFSGFDAREMTDHQLRIGIVRFFASLYVFMTSSEMVFFSMLPGMVVAGIVMTGFLKLMLDADWITKAEVENGIKAKEELDRLLKDPYYGELEREYRRRRKKETDQVNEWMEEWFAVCKSKKNPFG